MNIYTEIANTINKLTILQLAKQGVISPRGVAHVFGIPYRILRVREGMPQNYRVALFETAEQAKLVRAWRVSNVAAGYKSRIAMAKISEKSL